MELIQKLDIMLSDTISTGDVATNTAKDIDVVGGKCPDGQVYDKIKKACVPSKNESGSVSSMVAGSQQTRVWGVKRDILDLARKEPVENEMDDPTDTNIIGRKSLRFDKKSGAYIPDFWGEE